MMYSVGMPPAHWRESTQTNLVALRGDDYHHVFLESSRGPCAATLVRLNEDRVVSILSSIAPKVCTIRPDMVLCKDDVKLGSWDFGFANSKCRWNAAKTMKTASARKKLSKTSSIVQRQ